MSMSDEKIEEMFQLLHEENKAIMMTLLSGVCYPKDYEKCKAGTEKNWDELFEKVMRID